MRTMLRLVKTGHSAMGREHPATGITVHLGTRPREHRVYDSTRGNGNVGLSLALDHGLLEEHGYLTSRGYRHFVLEH